MSTWWTVASTVQYMVQSCLYIIHVHWKAHVTKKSTLLWYKTFWMRQCMCVLWSAKLPKDFVHVNLYMQTYTVHNLSCTSWQSGGISTWESHTCTCTISVDQTVDASDHTRGVCGCWVLSTCQRTVIRVLWTLNLDRHECVVKLFHSNTSSHCVVCIVWSPARLSVGCLCACTCIGIVTRTHAHTHTHAYWVWMWV